MSEEVKYPFTMRRITSAEMASSMGLIEVPVNAVGTAQSERRNLPYDQHGGVDWKKLREWQLQGYETAELEAELARRIEQKD